MNRHQIDHPSGQKLTVYEVPGPSDDAPTIILLHGLGASFLLNWKPVLASMARDYRILGVDHRGHSRGLDSKTCRFEDCADDVATAIDAMGIKSATLAGYSMGGAIALQVWKRQPGKVNGILLTATASSLTHLRTARYYLALPLLLLVSMFYALAREAYFLPRR